MNRTDGPEERGVPPERAPAQHREPDDVERVQDPETAENDDAETDEDREILAALDRATRASVELLERDAAAAPPSETWLAGILRRIAEAPRSGRTIILGAPDGEQLTTNESALRTMIRAAGESSAHVLIGRTRVQASEEDPGAPLAVEVSVTAALDDALPVQAERVRSGIARVIARELPVDPGIIDVRIDDVDARLSLTGS